MIQTSLDHQVFMYSGMKFLIFAAFLATVTAQSQNTELVDYLLAVHDDTRNYYQMMADVIANTRSIMVQGTLDFNNIAVRDVAEGLKAIVEIRDELEPLINDATGTEECVQTAVLNWQNAFNNSGLTIASCIQENLVETSGIIDVVNSELGEQHAFIFDVQNLILNAFSEVNIITNQQGLTPFINNESIQIVQTFVGYTALRFGRLLEDFGRVSRNDLMEIQACIADTVSRVRDEAIVVANTLEFC